MMKGCIVILTRFCLANAFVSVFAVVWLMGTVAQAEDPWIVLVGGEGPGKGKHVVLVSGDEEYRSEEALPQLAKILAKHHGFKCTVLFAIDKNTGEINPDVNKLNVFPDSKPGWRQVR